MEYFWFHTKARLQCLVLKYFFMRKISYLFKKLTNDKVQCLTCEHKCVLPNGKYGFCGVRKNINGILYFMQYSHAIAENIDPIEKKPIFNYLSGTKTLTIATVGCNFCCRWCQNWDISQATEPISNLKSHDSFELTPQRAVKDAMLANCPSISYSYTEPTVFLEYALDTMKIAYGKGLKNIWVSNGYMTTKTLELILPYLDAANIDLKTFDEKKHANFTSGKLKPVLKNIEKIAKTGKHLEITTLVIPTVNDKKSELLKIAKYIKNKLGTETPWHITRYYPAYRMIVPPVSKALIKDIYHMAKNIGLKNVFIGNI